MTRRRTRKLAALSEKATDIALSAPPVMAYRIARMAASGPYPSVRDRRELARMVGEKQSAFFQSWNAMALQIARTNLLLATSIARSFWFPFLYSMPSARNIATRWNEASLGILGKGLAPTHRTVMANHRRLSRLRR